MITDQRLKELIEAHGTGATFSFEMDTASALLQLLALRSERQWRPIESAPRDGTEILVTYKQCDSWFVHNAFWIGVEGDDEEDIGWWSYLLTEVTRTKLNGCCEPTHWMLPFPSPPEGAK